MFLPRTCAVALATLGLMIGFTAAATAGDDQEGRLTGSSTIDGGYAEVTGNGFGANPGQCVLYGVTSTDFTGN